MRRVKIILLVLIMALVLAGAVSAAVSSGWVCQAYTVCEAGIEPFGTVELNCLSGSNPNITYDHDGTIRVSCFPPLPPFADR